jgi:hypothetical protein
VAAALEVDAHDVAAALDVVQDVVPSLDEGVRGVAAVVPVVFVLIRVR